VLVGRSQLERDLRALGLRPGAVVLAHCRMSALGAVLGGAETVVRALLDTVGHEGTLVAYIGWQDGPPDDLDTLSPAERALVRAEHPVYDPCVARARRDHGRLAETLRTWPGAVWSGHPEAGIAAVGPKAEAIAVPHPLDEGYGRGTPYERVVAHGGQVVLLGAPLDTVTLVHHAETIAAVAGKRRVACDVPLLVAGERTWRTLHDVNTSTGALDYTRLTGGEDYVAWFAKKALERGDGRSGVIGAGQGHVLDARPLVTGTVALIEAAFPPTEAAR
jgi:aminoglycoside 3-N-acetyltransferase